MQEEIEYKNQTKRLEEEVSQSQRVIKKVENKSDIQTSIEIKVMSLRELHELRERV